MPYKRGQVVRLIRPITEVRVGEDHGSSVWVSCDGSRGTPDLRDRFVVGAGNGYAVAATGGEAAHTLTVDEMPAHAHSYEGITGEGGTIKMESGLYGAWPRSTGSAGGGKAHENRPPYYALAYIMRVA